MDSRIVSGQIKSATPPYRRVGLALFLCLVLLASCSNRFYREQADRDAYRIIERIEPARVIFVGLAGFDAIRLGLIHDFDIQAPQPVDNFLQLLRPGDISRQRVTDIAVSQIPLLLCEPDEFPDFFRKIGGR